MSVFEFLTQTLIGRTYCSSYESTERTLTTNQKGLASQCILLLILQSNETGLDLFSGGTPGSASLTEHEAWLMFPFDTPAM